MAGKIGIIAEDMSDVDVIKKLAHKINGKNFSSAHFVGKGCGALKRKTPGWCKVFETKGCSKVVLVHDRDRSDAKVLRSELEKILNSAPQETKVVVIPEEELEAWLLSDAHAISKALNMKKVLKSCNHPELIDSPKEYIQNSVWKESNKTIRYVNSVHNTIIADHINVSVILAKCPSFSNFVSFFSPDKKTKKKGNP